MGQLHEVLAARTKLEDRAKAALANAAKVLNHEPLFEAHLQTYRHLEEDPSGLHREPPKQTHMTTTVGEVLEQLREGVIPIMDASFQIDLTNMAALGHVEVGNLKLDNIPTTHLMALEKRIEAIKGVLNTIPTHDPKHQWTGDQGRGGGMFKTEPVISYRTTKKVIHNVIVPPTKEHRAEIKETSEDHVTGEVTKQFWSGKFTQKQKNAILRKVDQLLVAIKQSLAAANCIDHVTGEIGGKIFDWMLTD